MVWDGESVMGRGHCLVAALQVGHGHSPRVGEHARYRPEYRTHRLQWSKVRKGSASASWVRAWSERLEQSEQGRRFSSVYLTATSWRF
jgi:hypothetical protein